MVEQWRVGVDGQRRVDPPRQQQQNFLQKSCPLFSPLHHNINQNIFSFSPLWFHLKYSAAAGAALPPHALPLALRQMLPSYVMCRHLCHWRCHQYHTPPADAIICDIDLIKQQWQCLPPRGPDVSSFCHRRCHHTPSVAIIYVKCIICGIYMRHWPCFITGPDAAISAIHIIKQHHNCQWCQHRHPCHYQTLSSLANKKIIIIKYIFISAFAHICCKWRKFCSSGLFWWILFSWWCK